jgi:hypothetical protein
LSVTSFSLNLLSGIERGLKFLCAVHAWSLLMGLRERILKRVGIYRMTQNGKTAQVVYRKKQL